MNNNKNVDVFRKHKRKTEISPFELSKEGGGQALVLRYAKCNFKCPLCYAWKYSWKYSGLHKETKSYKIEDVISALNHLPDTVEKKIKWVRIQGGEPCLTFYRILNTIKFAVESLRVIHENGLNFFDSTRVVIQTNATTFATLNQKQVKTIVDQLRGSLGNLPSGKLVFEVSFKSPHYNAYLKPQVTGFKVLLDSIMIPLWNQELNNVAVYPVAGLGPSVDQDNLYIIPIDPYKLPMEIPLFHKQTWSKEFQQLLENFINEIVKKYNTYREYRDNPNTNKGKKIAIEELEPTKFQSSWISGYANKYRENNVEVIEIEKLLRKLTSEPPTNEKWQKWYNPWTSKYLFGKNQWRNVLERIPATKNPNELIKKVQEMKNYFYPSHPKGHYPYL